MQIYHPMIKVGFVVLLGLIWAPSAGLAEVSFCPIQGGDGHAIEIESPESHGQMSWIADWKHADGTTSYVIHEPIGRAYRNGFAGSIREMHDQFRQPKILEKLGYKSLGGDHYLIPKSDRFNKILDELGTKSGLVVLAKTYVPEINKVTDREYAEKFAREGLLTAAETSGEAFHDMIVHALGLIALNKRALIYIQKKTMHYLEFADFLAENNEGDLAKAMNGFSGSYVDGVTGLARYAFMNPPDPALKHFATRRHHTRYLHERIVIDPFDRNEIYGPELSSEQRDRLEAMYRKFKRGSKNKMPWAFGFSTEALAKFMEKQTERILSAN